LIEQGVWNALKRALKNSQVAIEGIDPFFMVSTSALKPEPVDINVKVVVIGDERAYQILYQMDDEFRKIFKVKADFDMSMDRTDEAIRKYTQFLARICRDEKLLQFAKGGAARVVEYGVRIAGRQSKLTTKFSDIADAVREASYWATKDNAAVVDAKHVERAIDEKIFRSKLYEEKLQELIDNGTIMIDIEGSRVGQVNGLSVYDLGDYSFGKPSKMTAEVSLGRAGIIDIEREADLSGKTYNKAVLIIGGYLRGKYAQTKPLAMNASICFEQSYGGIDGDSASSTEIYAILSSLADVPLRQDIAVTGSVNQKGEIQPIGGVNQKIEGFFDVCEQKGLTGSQGVMIPSLNVPDLMLRKDVVEAVRKGQFHIYSVATIDEGIEILSGTPAGALDEDKTYPEESIHFRVNKKLEAMASDIRSHFYIPGDA
jgi:lon-related putative ATP-dependent protease